MRRSRIRPPTWSSIAAADRPLFGFAMLFTRVSCLRPADRRPSISIQRPTVISPTGFHPVPSTTESVDNLSFPHAAFDPMLPCRDHRQGKGAELLTIQTDLTTDSAADEITEAARAGFGRIDFLANNAGIGPGSIRPDSWQRPLKFREITPDQWRRFVAVHTTAPLALGERRRARDDNRRPSQGDREGSKPLPPAMSRYADERRGGAP